MPPELYAEEFETGLAIGIEGGFGVLAAPQAWVPGKCDVEYVVGWREVDLPINEPEETHVSCGRHTCDGKISFQVCPGQQGYFFGTNGILTWRDRKRPRSFSAYRVQGEDEAAVFRGLVVGEYTLKMAKGEDMSLEVDCKGVEGTEGAPWVPNYSGLRSPFILEEMDLWIAGMERVNFESLEITENRDLRDDIYGNSFFRQDITSKSLKRTVKAEGFRQKDMNILRDAHRSGTIIPLVARFARGDQSLTGIAAQCMVWKCNPDNVKEPVELKVLKAAGSAVAGLVWE